jgi:hypothetical protein
VAEIIHHRRSVKKKTLKKHDIIDIFPLLQINLFQKSMADGAHGAHGVNVLHHVAQGWHLEIVHVLTPNQATVETIVSETLLNISHATSCHVQVIILV